MLLTPAQTKPKSFELRSPHPTTTWGHHPATTRGHHPDHSIMPPQGDVTLTTPSCHHKGTSPQQPHPTAKRVITPPPQREITLPQGDIIPTITPTLTAPLPVLQFPVPACHLLLTDASLLLSFLSLLQFPLRVVHFHQLLKLSQEEEEKPARLAKL